MNDHGTVKECSRKTDAAQGCGHWETRSPAFWGHCSHASCPNYMEACPLHQTPAHREGADPMTRPPTVADVQAFPVYFIVGPGREIAERTECEHGYMLTSSCPGCDAKEG